MICLWNLKRFSMFKVEDDINVRVYKFKLVPGHMMKYRMMRVTFSILWKAHGLKFQFQDILRIEGTNKIICIFFLFCYTIQQRGDESRSELQAQNCHTIVTRIETNDD